MIELMAKTAHQFGTDSPQFRDAYKAWLLQLEQQPSHRPPVDMMVRRNGIVLVLQWAIGSEYKYVPHDVFDISQFCIELQTPRERILAEITTGRKARQEIILIEAGIIQPEEGDNYEDNNLQDEVEEDDVDDLVSLS